MENAYPENSIERTKVKRNEKSINVRKAVTFPKYFFCISYTARLDIIYRNICMYENTFSVLYIIFFENSPENTENIACNGT
jgi:hypothetical protein